jgi:hypothetical protein
MGRSGSVTRTAGRWRWCSRRTPSPPPPASGQDRHGMVIPGRSLYTSGGRSGSIATSTADGAGPANEVTELLRTCIFGPRFALQHGFWAAIPLFRPQLKHFSATLRNADYGSSSARERTVFLNNDAADNASERFFANPGEPCRCCVIRLTVEADGGSVILNNRNGQEKSYR